ncbi:hypothetical protein CONCODRAFT_9342 [Conidiobolus coronatus NRRL 28638]|uniref:F-box domain-containing protein n=1 Tax=Conidiobolus coronatus (strain ATCC 28846 / CBS 209.66 / NRRL 28638) TaxID=796925 RepID=A0A137P098_CONC2|nr:hypothetical protein CONCODRAFT_9342 [Conidiobolus coronatus NRRL 28638]|eukprot:KXN68412.1 hypothetical protein CONCODRAFT_9342 [Conidiobolus coronatus NRRL 28638]
MESSKLLDNKQNLAVEDWIIVFKLEEFHSCFNYRELKRLSLACKKIYYSLKPQLQSQIFFSLPVVAKNLVNKGIKGLKNVNSYELLKKFKISVDSISKYVVSIYIEQPPLYPQPYLYLKVFKNLKKLHFYQLDTKISLNNMNLILTRLPRLLELTLDDITINYGEKPRANYLLFSNTLTKLCINNCSWPDYNRYIRRSADNISHLGPYSIVSTRKFPQLVAFEYSSPGWGSDFNPINSILKNNHKLRTLKIDTKHTNQETLDLMDKLPELKRFEFNSLNPFSFDISLKEYYNIPYFLQITKFSYKFIKKSTQTFANIELLLTHFSNLKELSISFEKPILPYLKRGIKNSAKLKKLELVKENIENNALSLKLINRSITHLTLVNFKLKQVDFEDFKKWYALKYIRFKAYNFNTKLGIKIRTLVNLDDFRFSESWKSIDFNHYIVFYKE